MSVDRSGVKFALVALSGMVLSACSPKASTAVPPVQAVAQPALVAVAPAAPLVTGLPDFTSLVDRYGAAVVNVQVTESRRPSQARGSEGQDQNDPFGEFFRRFGLPNPNQPGAPRGRVEPQRGTGSGFIVTSDGYIMTNAHVVQGATDVVVKMTDRREFPAKIVGLDERTDVAVIKIDARDLPTVRIGNPDLLKPGQWVVAIGSPFGMENSVTAGIVSATSRALPSDQYGVPFIQTDVAVNPGNSGGPLFNLNGEVVGINSQIYSQSGGYMGLSFAIPINIANNVREQIVKTGHVTRGRIGVGLQPMNAAYAETFGLDRPRGALISKVEADGPAAKAGIKEGDIILSVDGKPVESDVSLPSMIAAIKPGSVTQLEVWSDRKLRTVTARVGEFKDEQATATNARGGGAGAAAEPSSLGLSVRPLSPEEKKEAETEGSLLVEGVTGPAEAAGVRPGDVILGVNGSRVTTVAQLTAAAKRSGKTVALLIQREDGQRFISIRTE